jgi:alginate O-acetyltransferase complex protein AlgI
VQFNSIIFIAALSVFFLLYFVFKNKYRKAFLLIINFLFYLSFGYAGLLVLISVLVIVYLSGITLDRFKNNKSVLLFSILSVLLFLVAFKYYNFFTSIISGGNNQIPVLKLASPIGLSFYTFSGLSYLVEVYRKRVQAEKNIFTLAQFITFFPLIVSGPIERPYNLLPQLKEEQKFDYERIKSGMIFITLGFFKKVVIADRLSELVDKVFSSPGDFKGIALLIGAVLFSIQIYCDFSGYTDIAIGIARIMGFSVLENFNIPYYSKSIQEFWTRWHMSLSSWLRDYIFLPVAYSVTRKLKNKPFAGIKPETISYFIGISITMLICGLWHGANWTFIVWGMIHAVFLIFAFATKKIRRKLTRKMSLENSHLIRLFKISFTFFLVTGAWVIFRANNLYEGYYIIMNSFDSFSAITIMKIFSSRLELIVIASLIIILELVHLVQRKYGIINFINGRPAWQRWGLYYFFVFTILIFGRFESASFIYAKF